MFLFSHFRHIWITKCVGWVILKKIGWSILWKIWKIIIKNRAKRGRLFYANYFSWFVAEVLSIFEAFFKALFCWTATKLGLKSFIGPPAQLCWLDYCIQSFLELLLRQLLLHSQEESHVKWGARSLCSTFVVHHWCNSRFMVTKWPLPWFYGGWSDKKGIFLVWETSRFANWPVKSRYGRFATPETR